MPSQTSQRIFCLWAAACGLSTAPDTMHNYQNLLRHSNSARPRFLALFVESVELLTPIAARINNIQEHSLRTSCEAELLKYPNLVLGGIALRRGI
jgi:hypothetical protein